MKKFLLPYILVVLLIFILYPKASLGFNYQGSTLGVSFTGDKMFDSSNLFYPGANICKDLTFTNLSDSSQPLSFSAQGFNVDSQMSVFFNLLRLTVKDNSQIYVNKVANAISADTNNPENITNLAANSNITLSFCMQVDSSMGNEYQGFTSGLVDFIFGFVGEEFTPLVPVFGPTTTTGEIIAGTTSIGATAPTIVGITTPPTTTSNNQGEVAGEETNNQNMCCNWVWWNLLPWILAAILLIWLIWMWASNRNRRLDKEDL